MIDLDSHQPDAGARSRAEAAGLDLDILKREEPLSYMMLCSLPVMRVDRRLKTLAAEPLGAVLDDQRLFEAEVGEELLMLAFPGPRRDQLERLDELMGQAVEAAVADYAYYRVVRDRRGTTRELSLPTAPDGWQGTSTMVGPFEDEAAARRWGQERVVPVSGTTYDTVPYAGGWFCDVFSAADAEV
ncbi:MAG TPA: hypothetical protein VF168_03095 [Trueperaceae bacterium]